MGKTTKYDLAYFAGFIDGGGCIGINKQGKSKAYRLELRVGSTNLWILQLLKMHFGGWVYPYNPSNKKPTHRQFWVWVIYSRQASELLKELLPYLKLKKVEAEVAIDYQANRPKRGKRKTTEDIVWMEAQKILLQELKKVEVQDNR